MKNFNLFFILLSFVWIISIISCTEEKNGTTTETTAIDSLSATDFSSMIPDPCDCAKNALKFETPEHDKALQQRCEEYGETLEGEEKEKRAAKGMECVKEFLQKMQVPHDHQH